MPAPITARLRPLPDTTGWTDTDHQIASLLGRRHLSSRLTPTQLVLNEGEDHVPPALRPRVRALRVLVESRLGRNAPIARQLLSSADVARYFRDTIGHQPLESFWLLTCDSRNQLRTTHRVGSGGASSCPIRVDQILRLALLEAASAIIVVHNHPSGDPTPSPEDIELTSRLREAADVVGLRLLDHVIVSVSGATSFLDLGLMTHEAHRG